MTSSNGNIFRVTAHLCGEFTGLRWIARTKASDAELWCFLWSAPEYTVELTIARLVIWEALTPIMTSLWWEYIYQKRVFLGYMGETGLSTEGAMAESNGFDETVCILKCEVNSWIWYKYWGEIHNARYIHLQRSLISSVRIQRIESLFVIVCSHEICQREWYISTTRSTTYRPIVTLIFSGNETFSKSQRIWERVHPSRWVFIYVIFIHVL